MRCSRRQLLGTALAGTTLGLAGCGALDANPSVTYSASATTDEPLLTDVDLALEAAYPQQYAGVFGPETYRDRLRWDYMESVSPPLFSDLDTLAFDGEFLAVFGMVLPLSRRLSVGSPSVAEDTLELAFTVEESETDRTDLVVATEILRIEHDGVPADFAPTVRFQASPDSSV